MRPSPTLRPFGCDANANHRGSLRKASAGQAPARPAAPTELSACPARGWRATDDAMMAPCEWWRYAPLVDREGGGEALGRTVGLREAPRRQRLQLRVLEALVAHLGFGRIVALHCRSSTLHHIR
jgi:hypothetical protein